MINTLYQSILRINIIRYFRNNHIYLFYLMFFIWLLSFLVLCISAIELLFVIGFGGTFCFVSFFSNFFWGAWAAGNTDPFTGLHTEKNKKDRYCVPFMSCLPINRKRLYAVQVLLYIMISAAICIISFMIQIIFPQARSHLNFIIYMHFSMFTLLILSGGLHSVLSLPFSFRGEMKDYKHPAIFIFYANIFLYLLVLFVMLRKTLIGQYQIKMENFSYIIDRPFVLLIPLVAGILMLWLGGIIFKSIDIK